MPASMRIVAPFTCRASSEPARRPARRRRAPRRSAPPAAGSTSPGPRRGREPDGRRLHAGLDVAGADGVHRTPTRAPSPARCRRAPRRPWSPSRPRSSGCRGCRCRSDDDDRPAAAVAHRAERALIEERRREVHGHELAEGASGVDSIAPWKRMPALKTSTSRPPTRARALSAGPDRDVARVRPDEARAGRRRDGLAARLVAPREHDRRAVRAAARRSRGRCPDVPPVTSARLPPQRVTWPLPCPVGGAHAAVDQQRRAVDERGVGESRNATTAATSCAVPMRPIGGRRQALVSSWSSRPAAGHHPGPVSPGQTALTRMPTGRPRPRASGPA